MTDEAQTTALLQQANDGDQESMDRMIEGVY